MIEVDRLSKRFGAVTAVDHLSFAVEPGKVTGFLGPNGAGKSTTMRLILGLDHPNTGTATIDGKPYRDLVEPLRWSGRCWRRRPSTPVAARTTICSCWRRPRACRASGSTR
jgi:ABC-2 type transport system ATP-binding protein